MKFGLNKERLVSGLIGVFMSAAGITGGDMALDSLSGKQEFRVTMSKEQVEAYRHGKGDITSPYKDLAVQIDPFITQGGQSADIVITTENEQTTISHQPVIIEQGPAPSN